MLWLKELHNPLLPENIKMNFASVSHTVNMPQSIVETGTVSHILRAWWRKVKRVLAAINHCPEVEVTHLRDEPLRHNPERYYETRKASFMYDAVQSGLKAI